MNAQEKITRLNRDLSTVMKAQSNLKFMRGIEDESMDLIVTSPPYNIGKSYEKKLRLISM